MISSGEPHITLIRMCLQKGSKGDIPGLARNVRAIRDVGMCENHCVKRDQDVSFATFAYTIVFS